MTGAVQSSGPAAADQTYRVTLANSGTGSIGYSADTLTYGSIAPFNSYKGKVIRILSTLSAGTTFSVKLTGITPQNFFSSVTLENSSGGGITTLTSASATYLANDGAGNSLWTWSSVPWTVGDVGNVRRATLAG